MAPLLKDIRNSFGSVLSDSTVGILNLVEVQNRSYNNFLFSNDKGNATIEEIFNSIFPVNDSFGHATLEFVNYRLVTPKFTVEECRKKSISHGSDLFVTLRLIFFNKDSRTGVVEIKSIKEQEVLICNLPLMTENATFIINGFERVVVSQIHRSPGVFFVRDLIDGAIIYSASIIPYRGSWLAINFDNRGLLHFKIDKRKKLPIYYLLRAIGLDIDGIVSNFYTPLILKYDSTVKFGSGSTAWKFKLNLEELAGQYTKFPILDNKGNVLIDTDKMINRKIINDFKGKEDFYLSSEHISNFVLYSPVTINGERIYEPLTPVSSAMVETLLNNDITEITAVNNLSKTYSPTIISAIIAHKDVSYEAVMQTIFRMLRPGETFLLEEAEKYFKNIFFTKEYYNLFAVGRYKLNLALETTTDENNTLLQPEDIILTIKKLIQLKEHNIQTDDIDHLSNRRVRSVGELLENQFRIGLSRSTKTIVEKLNNLTSENVMPSDLIVSAPITKAIKDFFMTSQLSQFMDQTNPLSELAHKRRLSSLGAGGLTRERAGFEVRDVHNTHYGRICPVETPEGLNIGLISSLATYANINRYGFIETPYREVKDGVIQENIVNLDANMEHNYIICQADPGVISKDKKISRELVSARTKGEFIMAETSSVQLIDLSPKQIISVVTALIPFLENDDAKRALMGSNMQRQAVPLISSEAPLVGTGMESMVTIDSGAVVIAKHSGTVVLVDAQRIVIQVQDSDSQKHGSELNVYELKKFQRSNNSTCINQVPLVTKGENVKKGQIIADGPSTQGGEIALGKNLLVAFMPWNGYNFEDSIIISEKVVQEGVFTSIHIEEFEVVVRDTRLGAEEVTRDIPSISEEHLKYLDESGIVHLGVNVSAGDILVGKVTPRSESPITPEEKLLRAIFGEKIAEVKDSSLRVPPGVSGTVIGVNILTRRGNEKDARAKLIEQEEIARLKKAHEHEMLTIKAFFADELNKVLLKEKKFKYLGKNKKDIETILTKSGGQTSTKVDKILPIVITEDNITNFSFDDKFNLQAENNKVNETIKNIKEQYISLKEKVEISHLRNIEKILDGDDLKSEVLKIIKVFIATKSKLQPGDKMAGRHGNKGVVSKIIPIEDMPFMENGVPVDIVLNPLGVPSRMNIGQIMETHLGYASHLLGQKIEDLLKRRESASNVKKLLNELLTDSRLKESINAKSDEEVMQIAELYTKGIPFATPVFEGAKVEDIEHLIEIGGGDKSGQVTLYDGQSGRPFDRKITIGYIYMMKLHHLVDNKIHARSTGPYSLVTQQPLGGKSHFGGQRFGEMEAWALQAYGAAYTLQEMLTVKSDDVEGRNNIYESIVKGEMRFDCGVPESFNVLFKELRSLCFNVKLESND